MRIVAMKKAFSVAAIALSFFAGGCAIHPVPENVTGVSTYHIVRQIRCEARAAIIDTAIKWLTNYDDPEVQRIGFQFAEKPQTIATLNYKLFKNQDVRAIVKLFYDTGIAYNFDLTMTETNNLGAEINLLKPFTSSKATLGIMGSANRQRGNERTFTVTDKFGNLIKNVPDEYCVNHIVEANYIYPVAGKIGMEPFIQEFIRLTLFANLRGPEKNVEGPPTMVDALEFQTLFSGTLSPKVVFSPVGAGLSVADASITGVASRQDNHKVTVGLAIDKDVASQVDPLRGTLFGAAPIGGTLFGPLLTAKGSRSELIAAQAVNQALTNRLFTRTIIVTP
jgi:hypothetical protein